MQPYANHWLNRSELRVPRTQEADRAVEFINDLVCGSGDYINSPLKLRKWQENATRQIFGALQPDGSRQISKVMLFCPRKLGKTTFAAALATYALLGLGEPGGQILVCAGDREQAAHSFKIICRMIRSEPYLASLVRIKEQEKKIIYPRNGSELICVSSVAPTKLGYNPSIVIYDELLVARNDELFTALTTGFGARKNPLLIMITTAGTDRNSLCYEEYDYAKKVQSGAIKDKSYLPIIFEYQEEMGAWDDPKTWRKINPALGDYANLKFLKKEVALARLLPRKERSFRQFYLNQWTDKSAIPFVSHKLWKALEKKRPEEARSVYVGYDQSSTKDLTALSLIFPHDDCFYLETFAWIAEGRAQERARSDQIDYLTWINQGWLRTTPGDAINYKSLLEDIKEILSGFDVEQIIFDRWRQGEVIQHLYDDGLPCVGMGQGYKDQSPAIQSFERAVLSKSLFHDGSPVMSWCLSNVFIEMDHAENVKINKKKSRDRVDCVCAAVMAFAGAEQASLHRSVYDDKEFLDMLLGKTKPDKPSAA